MLDQAGVHVPQILASDLERGFLLLTDLGRQTYLDVIDQSNAEQLFEDAVEALLKFQLHPVAQPMPAYDEALDNAAKAKTTAERGTFYQQAEDLLARDVPAIPVYHYVRTHLVKPWVGGFTPDKLGYYFTKDMYIKKH